MTQATEPRTPALARAEWGPEAAAHLLNRAGFGGTPAEIARLADLGPEGAVDDLLSYERYPEVEVRVDFSTVESLVDALIRLRDAGAPQSELLAARMELNRQDRLAMEQVRAAWIARMVRTRRVLQEKMVLFWHGHLTSSYVVVQSAPAMHAQHEFFRRNATGSFRDIVVGISKDPAMLRYLDNYVNRKGRPNENYARELMELFTIGIGNYTEQDVKEAARAFTGWTFNRQGFVFVPQFHDDGPKTFMGRRGNLNGEDIIEIILQQPQTAEFMARKLWAFFGYRRPDQALVERLAGAFRESRYSVKALLRAIFTEPEFYSPRARLAQIKSPAELVIGSVRLLGLQQAPEVVLGLAMDLMGQSLFLPPNVKGWDGGEAWINTATLFVRYNFSGLLLGGQFPGLRIPGARAQGAPVAPLIQGAATAGAVVDRVCDLLLQRRLDGQARSALLRALGAASDADQFALNAQTEARVRSVVHLVMSSPEYQVA